MTCIAQEVLSCADSAIARVALHRCSPKNINDSSHISALKHSVDEVLKEPLLNRILAGAMVYDITSGETLIAHNSTMQMRPASVMKTLTTCSAIHYLGGAYQYITKVFTSGTIHHHRLKGNLYIKAGYDPRFNSDDMLGIMASLEKQGIKAIDGNIIFDVSLKDTLRLGAGWCWDDDDMRITPLLYDATDCFEEKFIQYLHDTEIEFTGKTLSGIVPAEAKLICQRSHSLDQILMRMLKESDNTYAESLLYQLGALSDSPYASTKVSTQKVKEFIGETLGMDPQYYNIADGSGLSLYNYLTPQLITKMLCYAWNHSEMFQHLFPALPIAGEDGTLANRMNNGFAHLNVHAKTGTETGVSALAGYCTSRQGHTLAFALFNAGQLHSKEARDWQDRFLQALTAAE